MTTTGPSFTVKFTPDGNAVWGIPEEFDGLAVGPDGSLYGTGRIYYSPRTLGSMTFTPVGRDDIVSARIDSAGNITWARAFADSSQDNPGAIAVDAEGGVWITGSSFHQCLTSTYGAQPFGFTDMVLARYASAGPHILSQPVDQTIPEGAGAEFSIQLEDSTGVSFQWAKRGVNLSDGGHLSGTHSERLTIANAGREDEGDYAVRLVGADGAAVLSGTARLHVTAPIQFRSIQSETDGFVRLAFLGTPDRIFRFEASDDLSNWSFLTNSGPNSDNIAEIIVMDRVSTQKNARFYRATSQ